MIEIARTTYIFDGPDDESVLEELLRAAIVDKLRALQNRVGSDMIHTDTGWLKKEAANT